MSEKRILKVTMEFEEDDIERLKVVFSRNGQKLSATQAIDKAVTQALSEIASVKIIAAHCEEIRNLAGLPQVPRSSVEILEAFKRVAKLDEYSAVVTIDPGVASQLRDLSDNYGFSFAEYLSQIIDQATREGFVGGNVEMRALMFDQRQWQKLLALLEVERVPNGGELIKVLAARMEQTILG